VSAAAAVLSGVVSEDMEGIAIRVKPEISKASSFLFMYVVLGLDDTCIDAISLSMVASDLFSICQIKKTEGKFTGIY
jgi:hypothetical protein